MPLKEGDVALINYTIKVVEDGEEKIIDTTIEEVAKEAGIFDEKKSYEPIPVIVGRTQLIDAVMEALNEMEEGEKREIIAPPEKAYGPHDESLVIKIPVKRLLRNGIRPRVGLELEMGGRKGRIIRVTERFAYIDFNHPLAGKTLKVDLELVKVLKSDEEKIKYIAARWLRLPSASIELTVDGDKYILKLPPSIIMIRDLDTILQHLLDDIYRMTNANKIDIVISFEFRREQEKEEKEEEAKEGSGESTEEAKEEEAEQSS